MSKPAKKLSDLPSRPPADLEEAVLHGVLSEITEQRVSDYVDFFYHKKKSKKGAQSLLIFSTLGFAFYNWYTRRKQT